MSRSSSQANRNATSPLASERSKADQGAQDVEKAKQEENAIREASLRQAKRDGVSSFDFLPRQAQIDRQTRLRDPKSTPQGSPQEDRVNGTNYPFLTQNSVFSEPSAGITPPKKEPVVDRLLERGYQTNPHASKASVSEESHRRLHDERQKSARQTPKHSPVASRHPLYEKQIESKAQINPQTSTLNPDNPEVFSQQLRNGDEVIQNHRSMLALINDNNKRAGRISPLPQAVQGAQGQKRGPSSDPSISNEFSRMFAGIGSGVGSTGLNSGASTPFPPSPKQNSEVDQRIPFNSRGDLAKSRNGSSVSRKGKRVKEDDIKDLEIMEDRSTRGLPGARAMKKSRLAQPHHHHINQ